MKTWNPLEAMQRLEAAGIPRAHAEAIAAEIWASRACRVTEVSTELVHPARDRVTMRSSLLAMAAVLLACAVLSVVLLG